jgi:hypothetical protein
MRFCSALVSFARRRTLRFVLFPALFTAPLLAQFSSPYQSSPATHVLTGTVVNSATGAPIPYALVQAEQNTKLADQNGNFRFENLASTVVNVQAHKPGFFEPQELGQFHTNTTVTLSDRPTDISVPLVPEAVITGHVSDPEGEPLANLPVRLRFGQIVNGRRIWQQQGQVRTDEDGNFRVAELRPGVYYVEVGPNFRARPVPRQKTDRKNFEVIPAEFYPGAREMSAASPIPLIAGQNMALDFAMKSVPAFHVSGVMTGSSNSGGLMLLDQDGDNTNIGIRFEGRTGRFSAFPVPAGSYRLHFNGRDGDGQQLFADVPINVTEDIPELRIPVERTVNIPVEFEAEFTNQTSQPGGVISNGSGGSSQPYYGQVHLFSRSSSNRQFASNRGGPSNLSTSEQTIMGVEPGTYDVEIQINGSSYVASATYAGVDLLRQPLVIAEGSDPQPIHVVLRDDGASISGTVQVPDSGNKSALVLMMPEGETSSAPRQVYVDSSGSFRAQGIAPGSYEILAFDRLDGLEYRNQEVLNAYLSHAARVTLSADEQARVTVDLIQTKQ